jgi:uncharacterized protein YjbI with pentapeptide repeats
MSDESNESIVIQIIKQYSAGQRQFSQVNLERANLKQAFLGEINLSSSVLNYAILEQADLSNSSFHASCLVKANLSRANLRGADFTKADLTGANMTGAALIGANFAHANLSKANLSLSRLIEANMANSSQDNNSSEVTKSPKVNFQGANLAGAFLMGVDLSLAQLEGAFFDDKTNFISSFDPIKAGMVNVKTVEAIALDELLAQFNYLIGSSNRFLGPTITTKYFNSSRPDYSWLNQFQIDPKNHICFVGTVSGFVSLEQLDYFRQWIDSFTQTCSKIIRNFPEED